MAGRGLQCGGAGAAAGAERRRPNSRLPIHLQLSGRGGRIPELKAWLDKDAARQRAAIASEVRGERAQAKKNGRDFNPYDSSTEWKVVADLKDWLSLSGMSGEYTGGAHPNHGPAALLWDKLRRRRIKAVDLFESPAALSAATRAPFCAALDRQRAERRGQPLSPKRSDLFENCLDPAGQVVILGSADHTHFTRIGFLMGPYVAGPYAEGDYEVTLPVTPAMLSAVRPEFRAAFALAARTP